MPPANPRSRPQSPFSREQIVACYERHGRNKAAAARELGLARSTVVEHVQAAGADDRPLFAGRVGTLQTHTRPLPKRGKVACYILTCAQNNTPVHIKLWDNLQALAKARGAEILVSQLTYNQQAFGKKEVKPGQLHENEALWYAPEIVPFVCNDRVRLAPDFVFCGELNVLPTAVSPLSGFETYTGKDSCAIPHTKIAFQSVPRAKGAAAKHNMTTGACTLRNYVAKKAGQKAEFHHAFGALYVEVDSEGDWFARQLNADDDGTIYDLTTRVRDGRITEGHRVQAIVWGDIHVEQLDPTMRDVCWGNRCSIIDTLRPKYQFFHDLLDFYRRNHHHRGDPHIAFKKFCNRKDSVEDELDAAAAFLEESSRRFCQSVVVASNHDAAFTRWLKEGDYKADPQNALLFLEGNAALYRSIRDKENFYAPEWALKRTSRDVGRVRFLRIDESFKLSKIECGMHGHEGPNGYRGSPAALARLGAKAIIGHSHTPAIVDGLYVVGVSGSLDQGYNTGPSSWSHTNCIVYENGKRSLFTLRNLKWRAKNELRRKTTRADGARVKRSARRLS